MLPNILGSDHVIHSRLGEGCLQVLALGIFELQQWKNRLKSYNSGKLVLITLTSCYSSI